LAELVAEVDIRNHARTPEAERYVLNWRIRRKDYLERRGDVLLDATMEDDLASLEYVTSVEWNAQ